MTQELLAARTLQYRCPSCRRWSTIKRAEVGNPQVRLVLSRRLLGATSS